MLIPTHVVKLYEADVTFGKTARHEAVVCVGAALFDFGAIHVEDGFGLVRDVGEFGNRGLHAVGELVLLDAGVDLRIGKFGELLFVELGEVIEHFASGRCGVAGGVGKIEDGVADGHEFDAGVFGREEARPPKPVVKGLAIGAAGATGNHGDEIREVFVF